MIVLLLQKRTQKSVQLGEAERRAKDPTIRIRALAPALQPSDRLLDFWRPSTLCAASAEERRGDHAWDRYWIGTTNAKCGATWLQECWPLTALSDATPTRRSSINSPVTDGAIAARSGMQCSRAAPAIEPLVARSAVAFRRLGLACFWACGSVSSLLTT